MRAPPTTESSASRARNPPDFYFAVRPRVRSLRFRRNRKRQLLHQGQVARPFLSTRYLLHYAAPEVGVTTTFPQQAQGISEVHHEVRGLQRTKYVRRDSNLARPL